MKFALAIYGSPCNSQAPQTALNFAYAALSAGHKIMRLFFYQDGVNTATQLCVSPQDEQNIPVEWQTFISTHNIDAVVCIASALRRGIVNQSEAKRYGLKTNNLDNNYKLSGLGQLIDAVLEADRLIIFGG
ncbi:MAG: sulfurtransferase complex subunit TusD [Candidatus Endonucleobacter bathymodioli]|uniref:Sulfurtransferase complex subunit TusD n=1 Tax=Candidatus Endonucleibacter bathymodioli TaxID=539814 RepID=A0AA90NJ54_9GAMM|nr:sulfurtransferase complex subunit TusD [Candidatus Endonucleobacter bathymodioli]